eukprot:scpid43549/ scgid27584/ 
MNHLQPHNAAIGDSTIETGWPTHYDELRMCDHTNQDNCVSVKRQQHAFHNSPSLMHPTIPPLEHFCLVHISNNVSVVSKRCITLSTGHISKESFPKENPQ